MASAKTQMRGCGVNSEKSTLQRSCNSARKDRRAAKHWQFSASSLSEFLKRRTCAARLNQCGACSKGHLPDLQHNEVHPGRGVGQELRRILDQKKGGPFGKEIEVTKETRLGSATGVIPSTP